MRSLPVSEPPLDEMIFRVCVVPSFGIDSCILATNWPVSWPSILLYSPAISVGGDAEQHVATTANRFHVAREDIVIAKVVGDAG